MADDLRRRIAAASPGDRLPSVRELARLHAASPVTVQRALTRLSAEGAIDARPGRGTFVRARPAAEASPDFGWQTVTLGAARIDAGGLENLLALPDPGAISLAGGFPEPALLPTSTLGAAVSRAARRASAWTRIPMEGLEDLRAWFARDAGGHVTASDVLVTAGAQSALATLFRALGRPSDEVIVEAPTYIGALAAIRSAGLSPVPVATDGDGIRVDYLEETLKRSTARLIVLQPTHANPYGGVLSDERRQAVLELAERHEVFVVEDDYARDLTIDGPVPPTLVSRDRGGYVIQIRSLSKSTAPGLRVAAVVSRGPAAARLRAARIVDDFFVSGMLQHTALEVVASPAWQRHLRHLRAELGRRRDVLVEGVRAWLPDWEIPFVPRGGLSLWVKLPAGTDDRELALAAARAGVEVFPGRPWFAAEPPAPFLRLSFASAAESQLADGVERLARAAGAD